MMECRPPPISWTRNSPTTSPSISPSATANFLHSTGNPANPLPNQNTSEGGPWGSSLSYSALHQDLINSASSADDDTSLASLPNASSLQGHSSFFVANAQLKAFGLAASGAADGGVGIGINFAGDVLIAAALHEITHAMGRIAGSSMDIFRYDGAGHHAFGSAIPAPASYFSIDDGNTDLADFGRNSDPGDFSNATGRTPNDPFNEIVGNFANLTAVDKEIMDVLGFHRADVPSPPAPANPPLPPAPVALAPSDFDGDHRSDILWRNDNGSLYDWAMNGLQIYSGGAPGSVDSSWQFEDTGDFDGDGHADIFWHQNSGANAIWEMYGAQLKSAAALPSVTSGWHFQNAADFDGDGQADVLWRNDSGAVYIWEMSGGQIKSGGAPPNSGTDWHIQGTGDFDGDGKSDVLWRNDNGAVWIWLMNGTQVSGGGDPGPAGAGYHVQEIADFDGDGKDDVLWRNDNGALWLWEMNGTQIKAGGALPSGGAGFQIQGALDFNGDGNADLLWRNGSGALWIWEMNGFQIAAGGSPGTAGTDWHVQIHHDIVV